MAKLYLDERCKSEEADRNFCGDRKTGEKKKKSKSEPT